MYKQSCFKVPVKSADIKPTCPDKQSGAARPSGSCESSVPVETSSVVKTSGPVKTSVAVKTSGPAKPPDPSKASVTVKLSGAIKASCVKDPMTGQIPQHQVFIQLSLLFQKCLFCSTLSMGEDSFKKE